MSNEFNYRGYSGSCIASIEDSCLHGRILFIDDLITYEGDSVSELEASFKKAVDEYINYCETTGKPANKPYSGTFNVRIGPELHKSASQCAASAGIKLNEFVRNAILNEVRLTQAQHEIKPNVHELAASNQEDTFSEDFYTVNPLKQNKCIAFSGSSDHLVNLSTQAFYEHVGIHMKGTQLVKPH